MHEARPEHFAMRIKLESKSMRKSKLKAKLKLNHRIKFR